MKMYPKISWFYETFSVFSLPFFECLLFCSFHDAVAFRALLVLNPLNLLFFQL